MPSSPCLNITICPIRWWGIQGVFSIPEFQELYFELTEKGSDSVEAALMTGALIEEMDIVDLKEVLTIVENENIIRVFEHLLIASRNHLRAFNRQLVNLGLVYTPVYLTQEEYDAIVNTPMETGHRYRVHYRGHNHRNGQVNGRGQGQGNGDGNGGDNGNSDDNNGNNGDGEWRMALDGQWRRAMVAAEAMATEEETAGDNHSLPK